MTTPFYKQYDETIGDFFIYYKGDLLGYVNPDTGNFQWHDRDLLPLEMSPALMKQFYNITKVL